MKLFMGACGSWSTHNDIRSESLDTLMSCPSNTYLVILGKIQHFGTNLPLCREHTSCKNKQANLDFQQKKTFVFETIVLRTKLKNKIDDYQQDIKVDILF